MKIFIFIFLTDQAEKKEKETATLFIVDLKTLNLKKGITYFEKILIKIAKVFSERRIYFCIENGENVIFQKLKKKFESNKNIYIEERQFLDHLSYRLIIDLIFESSKNKIEIENLKQKLKHKGSILFAVR